MEKERKRKILFVMQLPPPIHGVSVMNKHIRDSKVINEDFECHYINLATAKNIDDIQKAGFYKYILTLKILLTTFYKMATNRYDYVYITIFPWGFAFFKDSLVVILAKLFGFKSLLHLHTHGFKRNSEKSKFRKKYYQFIFKNTEVICLSPLLIEDIEYIYKGNVYILPNGIPQVNFENKYNPNQNPTNLLYLSNLIKGKGILILIDAIELIKNKGYDFTLRIAGSEGDVDYKTIKELLKAKNLEKMVELLGPKFNAEKYEEFLKASIFLLPSNYDTFGLVLLEAMQFGVPSISTNIGGIPDVLGNGRGIIINEITPHALADAIEQLIKNPVERAKMSQLSFDYYKLNFTVQQFEMRLKNILMDNADTIDKRLVID